jgi:hypothetical protein
MNHAERIAAIIKARGDDPGSALVARRPAI